MLIPEPALHRVATAILEHAGSDADEARVVADHLVGSNLAGHDSHGVGMLPSYVRFLRRGLLRPNTAARKTRDEGAIVMFDGGRGYGQRVAREAMDWAIERCAAHGVTLMTLATAHHVGRVGTYGEQALAAGLISIHFVNVQDHRPLMSPFRGSDARFGTNPVCVAFPGGELSEPFLLDMATSKIALGKARVAMNQRRAVAESLLIDSSGRPTTDPRVMFGEAPHGALLAMGEHKGYGLAMACELLAGVLSGGGTIEPGIPRRGAILNNMLTLLIDPLRLVDPEWMRRQVDAMAAYAKASPAINPDEGVLVAGDPERQRASERKEHGTPIDAGTWNEILDAAVSLGLAAERVQALAKAGA